MFGFEKYKMLAPDTEIGADAPETEVRVPLNEAPVDGPGSGRSDVRKQLEKGFEDSRKAEADAARERDQKTGKFKSRARQELEAQEQEVPEGQETPEGETAPEGDEAAQPEFKAPDGWAKDAKALWEQLPAQVQAAVSKREADMAKGVDDLKKKYSDIDQALAPRLETIRRHGHTPGQAVNQLFAWFDALSANPQQAFPMLAQSFKFDLKNIPGLVPTQEQAKAPDQVEKPKAGEETPAYVKALEQKIAELQNGFTQQFGNLSNTFAQQSQRATEENLMQWAKDKPYFEDVRRLMGHLIASQAVQPLPNGNADLDRAYDMAVYATPEVRAKIQAEQTAKAAADRKAKQEAERKAQQELADKARRATGSLAPSAPGAPVMQDKKGKKGKTVRDSIMEAREELSQP